MFVPFRDGCDELCEVCDELATWAGILNVGVKQHLVLLCVGCLWARERVLRDPISTYKPYFFLLVSSKLNGRPAAHVRGILCGLEDPAYPFPQNCCGRASWEVFIVCADWAGGELGSIDGPMFLDPVVILLSEILILPVSVGFIEKYNSRVEV